MMGGQPGAVVAPLVLPAVTAALVAAGVQTVVSVDEEPTMGCPECDRGLVVARHIDLGSTTAPVHDHCPTCDGSGRVPLPSDVEIRADGDIGEAPDGWEIDLTKRFLVRCGKYHVAPIVLDGPVARATVQCVPVVEDARTKPWPGPCLERIGSDLYLWRGPHSTDMRVVSAQLPYLDLSAPWALILSGVRPVEDR